MADVSLKQKVTGIVNNVRYNWKEPAVGKYMPYKEIAAYAFGGIGAYFIIQLGSTLIVSTANIIVSTAIGVGPTHTYIIYLIATLLNIPLTGIRANMIDNTRGKGGKYRPYLLSMGIPTALIALVYVWFPYELMYDMFPGKMFGYEKGYWIKVAVVFICNLALHFFFNFFRDAYENLIHVLSPNTQERTDVLAVKAVVYSLAPSIMNILNPVIAQYFANNNQTDIIVYKITYPIYAVLGIGLTVVVWANTNEKIVQAKTHTIQIRFTDALKEVAKNKYFWIIALAGWLGFLELAYSNILLYNQSYGHTATGNQYALAWTVIGNASLWGMLFAPFFVRKFGKKKVLIGVNLMNVVCIFMMIFDVRNFWWLVFCVWLNYLFGSVEQITTPAIQADIRDFQQYKSGERIDGMFAAVATIGNIVTLATSVVLPAVQEKFGIYEGNGFEKPFDILDIETGQPDLLYKFIPALIIMAAIGAFLNVVPYFFYDFDEKKQKSVIRVLQVRALFEDYANGALKNRQLVEAIDLVEKAREMCELVFEKDADMVVGDRLSSTYFTENKRPFHNFGNVLVRKLINKIYKSKIRDVMTGYRAFSYRFVKTFPVISRGFEVETEMTIHSLDNNLNIENVIVDYRDRPSGSSSKLRTVSDGMKVIRTIEKLYKNYKPLRFFNYIMLILLIIGTALFIPILLEYFKTGLVPKLPTLVVSVFFYLAAIQSFFTGIILQAEIDKSRQTFEIQLNNWEDKFRNKTNKE